MAADVFVHLVDIVVQVWLMGLVLLPTRTAVAAPPTPAAHPTRFRGGLHTGALGYTTPHPSRLRTEQVYIRFMYGVDSAKYNNDK